MRTITLIQELGNVGHLLEDRETREPLDNEIENFLNNGYKVAFECIKTNVGSDGRTYFTRIIRFET